MNIFEGLSWVPLRLETVNQYGQSTAFDHIKKIGYNYVQLQPIADRHKEYDRGWECNL